MFQESAAAIRPLRFAATVASSTIRAGSSIRAAASGALSRPWAEKRKDPGGMGPRVYRERPSL
jgi:hypothetical protein